MPACQQLLQGRYSGRSLQIELLSCSVMVLDSEAVPPDLQVYSACQVAHIRAPSLSGFCFRFVNTHGIKAQSICTEYRLLRRANACLLPFTAALTALWTLLNRCKLMQCFNQHYHLCQKHKIAPCTEEVHIWDKLLLSSLQEGGPAWKAQKGELLMLVPLHTTGPYSPEGGGFVDERMF